MCEVIVKRDGGIFGESDFRLWRRLFGHVKMAHARLNFDSAVWVVADEISRRKGTSN